MAAQFGTVTALPSGRYRARYRTTDGGRASAPTTFQTKRDAGAWLAEKQTELAAHAHRPAAVRRAEEAAKVARGRLFGTYASARIAARTLAPRTVEEYGRALRRYLLPTFGEMPLVDITPPVIRAWYDLMGAGRAGKRTDGLKVRANAYGLLSSILNDAVRDEFIPANPCVIRRGSSKRRKHIPVILTPRQVQDLVSAVPPRFRLLVMLAGWCGPRYGELTALRRCDVAEDGSEISITRAANRITGQGIVIGPPKSEAGIRSVAVPGPLAVMMVEHLERLTGPGAEALLFPSSTGGLLPHCTFNGYFVKARQVIGKPTLRLHDLRHVGATRAAEGGATLADLMARLGHSTPAAALIYQHASRAGDRRIADQLAEMMVG